MITADGSKLYLKMKRFTYILIGLAALVAAAASCKKEEVTPMPEIDSALATEWQLVETKAEGTIVGADMSIYLSILPDGTFELFQKSPDQTVRYDRYTGTCTSKDGILTGVYSDGTSMNKWMYTVSGEGLTLQSFNLLEVQKYKKATIPADVRENANDILTKSDAAGSCPIL